MSIFHQKSVHFQSRKHIFGNQEVMDTFTLLETKITKSFLSKKLDDLPGVLKRTT